jgi:Tfp pilus assembly major pilin PilA
MDTRRTDDDDLYGICVGEKANYYVPLFERFDAGGSRASWNWPAFFVTFFWMLYRRMYGYAFAYFLALPIVLAVCGVILTLTLGEQLGSLIYVVMALGVSWVAAPMFANALYHHHVRGRIAQVSVGAPSREAVTQRLIGQRATANAGVIVGIACVATIVVVGILAAIAIPAYQDYTIRAQVSEGLVLAGPVRNAVTQTYINSGEWPADLDAAGINDDFQGKYVESIEVVDGMIVIRYNTAAHRSIAGSTVSLQPETLPDGSVNWACGYAASAPPAGTNIPAKYLPTTCRPAK